LSTVLLPPSLLLPAARMVYYKYVAPCSLTSLELTTLARSLKALIKAIRATKTLADERALIIKESAVIRTSFKEEGRSTLGDAAVETKREGRREVAWSSRGRRLRAAAQREQDRGARRAELWYINENAQA
jgi:hypothetical protein